ncbi:MAG TPA: hypothetical protein ENJ90_11680 [Devosia sp.]|nr:hypothetical protein [Devosia sp.]
MQKLRFIYGLGCWLFGVVTGAVHVLFELAPKSEKGEELSQLLATFILELPGGQVSAYSLFFGISLLMGLMLIGFGIANLLVLHRTPKDHLPPLSFQTVNMLFSLLALLLAWNYLFILPTLLTGLSFLCFLFVLIAGKVRGTG